MVEIDQALYGYSNGHRLIVSSRPLLGDAGRTLRSLTDMAFDGAAGSYLTSMQLPGLRKQAVIRTWPATEASRPGSVWSHVLLIDFVDLGELELLTPLNVLFMRPRVTEHGEVVTSDYEGSLCLPEGREDGRRKALGSRERQRVLWAAYGGTTDTVLRVADPAAYEDVLFGVWAQQWPRLRRSFGFRTRYRVGEKAKGFDVQLVERLQRDQDESRLPDQPPAWLVRLDRDLDMPDPAFRTFLRRFGAESEDGSEDIRRLVEVRRRLEREDDPASVASFVTQAFPTAPRMSTLKSALFGGVAETQPIGVRDERMRLEALAYAKPSAAVDLVELKVPERLKVLWENRRDDAVDMVVGLAQGDPPNARALRMVVQVAIANARARDVARIAEEEGSLAVWLVGQRPDLLRSAVIWRSGDEEVVAQLLDVLGEADSQARQEVLTALLTSGAMNIASEVVRQRPAEWWGALAWATGAVTEGRSVGRVTSALGRLLDAVGPASIGSAPEELNDAAIVVLALAAPPQTGLWRQVDSERWLAVATKLTTIKDKRLRLRGLVVLLAATGLASHAEVRRGLWLAAFGPLERLLQGKDLADRDLDLLDSFLPKRDSPLPERLRAGAVREMRKAKWPPADVEALLAAAGAHRVDMLEALQTKGKKKKGWLREVFDFLSP